MSQGKPMSHESALALANELQSRMTAKSVIAESIRREKSIVHDIDLAVLTDNLKMEIGRIGCHVVECGDKRATIVYKGTQVNLYSCKLENLGAMLLFLTGNADFGKGLRVRTKRHGMKLNQYGLWNGLALVAARTEQEIFNALSKPYKAPAERTKFEH